MTTVTDDLLNRMVHAIVDEVDSEQAILFGSRGRSDRRADSDVDLIVVEAEPFGPKRSRHREPIARNDALAPVEASLTQVRRDLTEGSGNMTDWHHVELDSVADIRGGATPRRDKTTYWNGDIPWVTPTDLPPHKSGIAEVKGTADTITEEGLSACSATLLPPGTVIFSSRASIGKIGIATVPLATNQGFANLVPRPELHSRYLAWCLHFHANRITALAGSTTFREVTKSSLRRFRIPVPTLSEQRRLVEILDQANRLRRLITEIDVKSKRILPALFIKMFGDPAVNPMRWRTGALGDAIVETQYGTSKRGHTDRNGILVLRMNNISSTGDIQLTDVKYVDIESTELERQFLRPGDILFNRTNSVELVGKTGLWTASEPPGVAASYLIRVRVRRDKLVPTYLWALMNTPQMKSVFASRARRAVGMANINASELRRFPCMFPPLERQQAFAALSRSIRQTNNHRHRSKTSICNLFHNLLTSAFSGELTKSWRKTHRKELLQELEQQAKALEAAL